MGIKEQETRLTLQEHDDDDDDDEYYNLMGTQSYMRFLVDRNVVILHKPTILCNSVT